MSDYTHCPGNGPYFSPVAPPDYCAANMPPHTVPEPSTLALVLIGVAVLLSLRRKS